MKNVLVLFVFFLFILSCSTKNGKQQVPSTSGNYNLEYMECNFQYESLKREIRTELKSDRYYVEDQLFSGCAKQDFPDNNRYYIYYIKNGYIENQMVYFYNGQVSTNFNFKNGEPEGYHLMYHDNGTKYTEEFYKGGVMDGMQRRWYGNRQLAREVFYENGKIVYDYLYDKEGNRTN